MVWIGKCREYRSTAVLAIWFLYSVVDPEDQDQQKSLSKLEEQVEQWEEVEGADDFWGEGDLEDSGAKLYILAASFHAHRPPASEGGKVKQVMDLIHFLNNLKRRRPALL